MEDVAASGNGLWIMGQVFESWSPQGVEDCRHHRILRGLLQKQIFKEYRNIEGEHRFRVRGLKRGSQVPWMSFLYWPLSYRFMGYIPKKVGHPVSIYCRNIEHDFLFFSSRW